MPEIPDNLPAYITAAIVLVGAIITGLVKIINTVTNAKFGKTPTVAEVWKRQDALELRLEDERRARIKMEDRFRTLRDVFLDYVERVQTGGSSDLTPEERTALEETKETA